MAYISRYPILDIYHVGVTSSRPPAYDIDGPIYYHGYYAFDNSRSLSNHSIGNAWISDYREFKKQRIWADLESQYVISRIYYENYHDTNPPSTFNPALFAGDMNNGAYEGSIWASNYQPGAYGNYEGLVNLWEGSFDIHSEFNQSDPKYVYLSNSDPFRYYIIDIDNNYYGNSGIGFRRIELQELV